MAEKKQEFVKEITSMDEDFAQWYTDIVLKAELADYAPVKGAMIIRPYGYAIWENIVEWEDRKFKETGHKPAYFPLLIPEHLLQVEVDHFEGFAPEVLWVTHNGDNELPERLFVRPTSETIICPMFSKWIKSYRDLPFLMYQWNSVVRWEKTTRPFLRTSEFLWHEGHTVHADEADTDRECLMILELYREFVEEHMAIPLKLGVKTEQEKFAGALRTYTIEAMMRDGKSLQAGTSHNLGQHFTKMFDIKFLDRDGKHKYAWTSSWATTTRLIGAMVMVHSDNRGLVVPPRIAPIQVVIVPVAANKAGVLEKAQELSDRLKSQFKVELDDDTSKTPGYKFNEWEMKGVPVRIEIGPKDIEKNQVTIFRRDTCEKSTLSMDNLENDLKDLLENIQSSLFERASQFRDEKTWTVNSYDELKESFEDKTGYAYAMLCDDPACEEKIKDETGISTRCMPFDKVDLGYNKCIVCGKETDRMLIMGKSY